MPLINVIGGNRGWSGGAAPSDPHAYFESLLASPAFVKGWSLRPSPGDTNAASPYFEDMLAPKNQGGLHIEDCDPATWTGFVYDPTMDAAKSAIKPFLKSPDCVTFSTLTVAMDAPAPSTEQTIDVSVMSSTYTNGRSVRIDSEICLITGRVNGTPGTLTIVRGSYGSTVTTHAIGAALEVSINIIVNYLEVPLATVDGHTYVLTWDNVWDDSYMHIGLWDTGQKTFQLTNGNNTKLFEPKLSFGGLGAAGFDPDVHIAIVDARAYNFVNSGLPDQDTWAETDQNTMGPGWSLLGGAQLLPRAGDFFVRPNVVTRFWVVWTQNANDWDYFDLYVADEDTEPVLCFSQVALSVNGGGATHQVKNMWFEFNNSNGLFARGGVFDLVSHHRNMVLLQGPASVPALIVKPQGA